MNFYYHPIFGLQYTGDGAIYEVNLDKMPKNMSIELALNLIELRGINIIHTEGRSWVKHIHKITTNFNLN